jgi:hypothetical protein
MPSTGATARDLTGTRSTGRSRAVLGRACLSAYMRRYMPRWRGENREHWTAYLRKRYAVLPRDKLRAIAARYRANSRYSRALVPARCDSPPILLVP